MGRFILLIYLTLCLRSGWSPYDRPLYKVFDCLHHELLVAKLDVYGLQSMRLIPQYFWKSDSFYVLDGVTVASCADDTTHFSVNKTKDLVIKNWTLFRISFSAVWL